MGPERLADSRRILLVATHWLGDTFWALQTVPFLQRQHPGSVIQLLVRETHRWLAQAWLPNEQLFAARGLVSDRRRESIWRSLRLVGDLRRLRRRQPPIDLLIDYTDTRASALLTRALRPARSIGAGPASRSRVYSFWRDGREFDGHLAERPWWILSPIYGASAGWPTKEARHRPQLPSRPLSARTDRAAAQSSAGGGWRDRIGSGPREILAFPGAGWREKRWPLDLWIELARYLTADGLTVALLFSPEESALCQQAGVRLANAAGRGGEAALVSCSITRGAELLARLAGAHAVVANDSGAAHLAAALGVPTVAIFGPTNPRICGPLGPRVRILRAPCAQRPEGCRHHCYDEPGYRCDRDGLRGVTVSEVYALLGDLGIRGDEAGCRPSGPPQQTESRCGS